MEQDNNDGVVANKSTTVTQAATSNTHTSATPGVHPPLDPCPLEKQVRHLL